MQRTFVLVVALALAGCHSSQPLNADLPLAIDATRYMLDRYRGDYEETLTPTGAVYTQSSSLPWLWEFLEPSAWKILSLGTVWPCRDARIRVEVEATEASGVTVRARTVKQVQILGVIPVIWTDDEFEADLLRDVQEIAAEMRRRREPDASLDSLTRAAKRGDPWACYRVSLRHLHGLGVEASPARAAGWARRVLEGVDVEFPREQDPPRSWALSSLRAALRLDPSCREEGDEDLLSCLERQWF